MHIIKQAFKELYPDKELTHDIIIRYSGKFKPYNANLKFSPRVLQFSLSKEWKTVSREIKIGLLQSLLVKVFKGKPNTGYRDLYESFIKNLSKYAKKKEPDSELKRSFNRVNEKYFNRMMDMPNLLWGLNSSTKLGSYEYQTDTIKISSIFKTADIMLLDYIMYHELLHKKHKFYTKNTRNYHHTKEFRNQEKQFENIKQIEKEIKNLCRKAKIKRIFISKWL